VEVAPEVAVSQKVEEVKEEVKEETPYTTPFSKELLDDNIKESGPILLEQISKPAQNECKINILIPLTLPGTGTKPVDNLLKIYYDDHNRINYASINISSIKGDCSINELKK
jgi:hypothetical protein